MSDDEEPLSLGGDALAALQSMLGGTGDASLDELLNARRMVHDDSSSDDDDEDEQPQEEEEDDNAIRPDESHAEYYKRLYPERYVNEENANDAIENPVAIVSMDDEYVQILILKSFAKKLPHWKVRTEIPLPTTEQEQGQVDSVDGGDDYHFHWGEYEHIDWFSKGFTAEKMLVSCFYNRKGLIRKGLLASTLEKWHRKKTGNARIAPLSFVLTMPTSSLQHDGNSSSLKDEPSKAFQFMFHQALTHSSFSGFRNEETWIVKPSVTNQAKGICLVQSEEQLLKVVHEADPVQKAGDFVIQEYIPPLLLDGRKFHLRVFVVLQGNLKAYVFPEFLAIFSLEHYDANNIENTRAHLTNIAHQEVLSLEDQHRCMRLFAETQEDMVKSGVASDVKEAAERIEKVQQRVHDIVAETIEAVSSELTFSSKNNCFEIFGFDFMIDPSWNTWLLEANAEPDLSKAGDRLQPVIDRLLVETLDLVVGEDKRFSTSGKDDQNETSFVKVFERTGRAY